MLFLVIPLFETAPNVALSSVPMSKKAGLCLSEKIHVLEKPGSDVNYSAVGVSSVLMN